MKYVLLDPNLLTLGPKIEAELNRILASYLDKHSRFYPDFRPAPHQRYVGIEELYRIDRNKFQQQFPYHAYEFDNYPPKEFP